MQSGLAGGRAGFLATELAGRREFHFALICVLVSGVIFVVAAPFATLQLGPVPAFTPIYVSALVLCDVMTAVLLFGQFRSLRSRALLVLAGGYVFTAGITAAYTAIFPGMFSPTGLFGAGQQTTSAMYMLWHTGFPVAVIGYSRLRSHAIEPARRDATVQAKPRHAILISIAVALGIVVVLTLYAAPGHAYVPEFLVGNRTTTLGRAVLAGVWVLSLVALVALWRQPPHTVVDLWLMVVMCVWLFDIALSALLNTGRYDLGWYAGRIYGMLAASSLLVVLLVENGKHYARLAQLEGQYRGLLEAAPDPMVIVNSGGEIVLLNVQAVQQFGYGRGELLGQPVTAIIPDGFAERLAADRLRSPEAALAQQIDARIELLGQRRDGSAFPIEIMLSPMASDAGVLVTAAIRDVTARKEAEALLSAKIAELKRSNEELAQFASVASHDLQEPLRKVATYTQLLSDIYKGKLDAEADEFIAIVVDGANRMQLLIKDLLSFSRIGSAPLVDTSSEEALAAALVNLRGAIEDSGAVVTHDALPTVLADGRQLGQLFQNLVGNAIKYQKAGEVPHIHIGAARCAGKKWNFWVQDNGLGIAPQYFEKIFGMFQRLHDQEEYTGTGIGLAICKKIVERHGGSISVEVGAAARLLHLSLCPDGEWCGGSLSASISELLPSGTGGNRSPTVGMEHHVAGGLGQLNCQGLNRALALPAVIAKQFGKPDAVFAPDPADVKIDNGKPYSYVRPLATIEPAAIAFGLPVDASIGFSNTNALFRRLEDKVFRNSPVLVGWEHIEIVQLARLLVAKHGGNTSSVHDWNPVDFDSIYLIKITRTGKSSTVEFEQRHEGLDGAPATCPRFPTP